eukprot:GFUD01122371.1.p1 GENE.GFUD01122371.1~~GFUD01122371.1.p1  ORF type:complete len:268 (+),score=67.99 GFUD01122371.1:3-806(+)
MYSLVDVTEDEDKTVKQHFGPLSKCRNLMRTKPELVTLGSSFRFSQERVRRIELREEDVWVVTHPKCGTTWTLELTWHIMNGVNLEDTSKNLYERAPFIDLVMIHNKDQKETNDFFDNLDQLPSPRLIKTHYPIELLPPNLLSVCKVIFVCRNVKDVCVSYFHHEALMKHHDLKCDFITYARDIYKPGLVNHGGYFKMLESGWSKRNESNLLFLWYEDLKEDQREAIRKIMKHLQLRLFDEDINRFEEKQKNSFYNFFHQASFSHDI